MTTFIDEELREDLPAAERVPPGTQIMRRRRETRVRIHDADETDVYRIPVPGVGVPNPDILGLDFEPAGLEVWNYSYNVVILQLQNFRMPADIDTRYDIRVPALSWWTFGYPQEYAKLRKIGYRVVGLHTGMPGVVTIVATKDRRPTAGGSLIEGLSTNFDVYEADVPADAAFHQISFSEPAVSVEINSIPSGPLPANTAQMLSVQTTSDPNGLAGSAVAPSWNSAFTLVGGAAAGLAGGSESYDGLITGVNIKNLGAAVGRYSIRVLA